ncbi:hypothetical protein PYW07_004349 [Mythimna separata]|uniref:Uncharacterized protein n=1 Tax=Mythimna separata TaxID=271217 RepID=A0AAD8DXL0_MYTSE|nr:hypothetical protein PYW07_004349 [Mythimna separata]
MEDAKKTHEEQMHQLYAKTESEGELRGHVEGQGGRAPQGHGGREEDARGTDAPALCQVSSHCMTRCVEQRVRASCEATWKGKVDALHKDMEDAKKTHEEQMHQLYAKTESEGELRGHVEGQGGRAPQGHGGREEDARGTDAPALCQVSSHCMTRCVEQRVRASCEATWKGKVDALHKDMEDAKKTHEEQMHQLYAKVKVAVARKDSAIQALTREAGKYQEKITLLEQKLQQQRKDFLNKK